MIEFDHIGIVTEDNKNGEIFVEATRVWVTDFRKHPFRVEWLRFEPDTPVTGPVRTMPHLAFRTDSIAESSKGMKCLLEPFDTPMGVVGFFQTEDGAIIEFMEYAKGEAKPMQQA